MAFQVSLPVPTHFLLIRKWRQCGQVDGDPWEEARIWRILKLDHKASSDRDGPRSPSGP